MQILQKVVKIASYHCWTCKRCVEDMDHHCKYLNNCIGGRNYNSFLDCFHSLLFISVWQSVLEYGFLFYAFLVK